MEREEAHDFFLLKAKMTLDVEKDNFYLGIWEKKETDKYTCLDACWLHDDFIQFIYPSLTGLSVTLNYIGVSLIKERADAIKLARICKGWAMVINEMPQHVTLGPWETKFKREDLLLWMKKLRCMAEQMTIHDDYNILYCGI